MPRIGFALTVIAFGTTILLAAMLIAILQEPFGMIIDQAGQHTSSQDAATGQSWIETGWTALPFLVMLVGFVWLVAAASAKSERI